jgi:hypothetical protein
MTTPNPPTGVRPRIVGLIRALLILAALGALGAVLAAVQAITGADLAGIVPDEYRPLVLMVLAIIARAIEGLIDDLRGQAPQAGPLGGAPANPLTYTAGARHLRGLTDVDLSTLNAEERAAALDAVAVRRRAVEVSRT